MITAFTVKNFKAIGDEPVRIELKPITLLFGANSVGKSSILHALNYAYSVFCNRNLNAEYNAHSDSNYHLGGFERFINDNDLKRSVVLRFELDFKTEDDIPSHCLNDFSFFPFGGYHEFIEPYNLLPMLKPNEILAKSNNAYVEVEVSWDYDQNRPYVSNYSTGFNGEWIASIHSEGYKKKNYVCGFNVVHPIFKNLWIKHGILMDWLLMTCIKSDKLKNHENKNDEQKNNFEKLIDRHRLFKKLGQVPADCSLSNKLTLNLLYQEDALPNFLFLSSRQSKLFFGEIWRDPEYLIAFHHYYGQNDLQLVKVGCPDYSVGRPYSVAEKRILKKTNVATIATLTAILEDFLNSILIAPGLKITDWLNSKRYLGPLREIPLRHFLGDNNIDLWRWEKGLAAWDMLYWIGQLQLDQSKKSYEDISTWLKENLENYLDEIFKSISSDPNHEMVFDKYLDFDNPDTISFFDGLSKKSHKEAYEDRRTWKKENLKKYLNDLPADVLVSLDLPRKSSNLKEDADRLLYKINNWLSSCQRLNTGYDVRIERYREIPSEDFIELNQEKSQADMAEIFKKLLGKPERIRIWLHDKSRNINLSPHEIGTGISQVLPVVVAAVANGAQLVAIEQPELHIHPALQVQLGDLFITQSSDRKFFLIETHSEHLLLRILRRIRETAEGKASNEFKLLPNQVAVYYVESENGITQANRIGLDENGRFTDRWPKGFFAERMQEMLPSDIREHIEAKRQDEL